MDLDGAQNLSEPPSVLCDQNRVEIIPAQSPAPGVVAKSSSTRALQWGSKALPVSLLLTSSSATNAGAAAAISTAATSSGFTPNWITGVLSSLSYCRDSNFSTCAADLLTVLLSNALKTPPPGRSRRPRSCYALSSPDDHPPMLAQWFALRRG
jgi:hypothetical protein